MLICKDGKIDKKVCGASVEGTNMSLADNQFLQESEDGCILELWEGKREHLELIESGEYINTNIRMVSSWPMYSVIGYFRN